MKKYDSYIDSGIEWLGEIPEHWHVTRLKYLGLVIGGLTYSPNDIVEDGTIGTLVLRSSNIQNGALSLLDNVFVNMNVPDKLILKKGDILICSRNGSKHLIGKNICIDESMVGSTFGAFMMIFRSEYWVFLYHFFNSPIFTSQSSLFLTATINQLTSGTLNNFYIGIPNSLEEQTQIANYLNHKTTQIDSLIAKKERLIELLEEERTAIINQAVNKGLDPSVPMKDSGIEWLGEIPAHWEVKKLKFLLKDNKDALKTGPFGSHIKNSDYIPNGNFKVYTQRNVLDEEFDIGCEFISEEKYTELKGFKVFENDILITTRGSIGRCTEFPHNQMEGILHPCLIRIQMNEDKCLRSWITNYINNTSLFYSNVKYNSNSTIIDVIYGYTLKEIVFPVPPVNEQNEILSYLGREISERDKLKEKLVTEVELLKEYKTALINEVVTGKIDVRDEVLN